MYLRLLRRDDIPFCTSIFCDAFEEDELFAFTAPFRSEYPLAWRRYSTEKHNEALSQPGMWGLVCVSDGLDGKGAKDEILGYAWWRRKVPEEANKTDKYMLNNRSISATIEHFLRAVEKTYGSWFCPNQSATRSSDAVFARMMGESHWDLLGGVAYWHLSALAVSSQHQRKGVGNMLVNWGVELATVESKAAPEMPPVPVTLTSSVNGRKLYLQLGFKTIEWKTDIRDQWTRAMVDLAHHRKELEEVYTKAMQENRPYGGGGCMLFESRSYWIEQANAGEMHNGKAVDAIWSSNALQR